LFASLLERLVITASDHVDGPSNAVEGIVHLDLNRTNLLFDEVTNTLSLVDFDFAMPGYFLLDVGFCLVEYCSNQMGVFDPNAAEVFLQSYHSLRPFKADELKELKRYFAVVWIRSLTWLLGSPSHWSRPELLQFGLRVARAIDTILNWDVMSIKLV
jgi:Ser/Thr protein kinase RdoA (MazF antagonist)